MDYIRFEALIGKENFEYLKVKKIVIIGVGGVGGYTVESLARCGIENLMLIDFDKVDITNKNRQLIALDSTIGKTKVEVFKSRINDINKSCCVTCKNIFLTEENLNIIEEYNPDFIIDCCDSVKTKESLIKMSIEKGFNLISSMGTGKRIDASKLVVTSLFDTDYDPIARILRKYCKDNKINLKKVNVLVSREIPKKTNLDFIPSCSFVPSTAGLLITSFVVNKIISDNNKK